jgi:phage gp36-like protein
MPYASITDLSNRIDVRILGDLVSDTNTRVTNLTNNTILNVCLSGATGEINAACLVGERYTVVELSSLTGDDQAILTDLCCWLAFKRLRMRRGLPLVDFPQIDDAETFLQLLRNGDRTFNLEEQEAAGNPTNFFPSLSYYVQWNDIRDYAYRYFPLRRDQSQTPGAGQGFSGSQ